MTHEIGLNILFTCSLNAYNPLSRVNRVHFQVGSGVRTAERLHGAGPVNAALFCTL